MPQLPTVSSSRLATYLPRPFFWIHRATASLGLNKKKMFAFVVGSVCVRDRRRSSIVTNADLGGREVGVGAGYIYLSIYVCECVNLLNGDDLSVYLLL